MSTPEERREEHAARTRYLRPVEPISYSAAEMLTGIFSVLCPSTVSSITQLHGERKGVVRLTFTTRDAANDLDTKVATRRLNINGVLAAEVKEIGHFVKVVLLDVPDYLSSSDLEAELLAYGPVAYIKRDFHDIEGYHIDSEVRQVLYSWLDRELPGKISINGHEIFVTSKHSPQMRTRAEKESVQAPGKGNGGRGKRIRSRSASPIRCVSNATAMIVTEKPPSKPRSMTLPLAVPLRRSSVSSAHGITPEEEGEDKIIYMKSQTVGEEPKVNILQNHHQENKMADPTHYVEIIDSPHGTLPRKMYHKVSEVVETPVEEVRRNLSPYMERHQLRLQSQSVGSTSEKEPDVDHSVSSPSCSPDDGKGNWMIEADQKQDIVATSRVGWKKGENLASPAVTRRTDSIRDRHGLGCVSNETAMIVTEKRPSQSTSMTLPQAVPFRRSSISSANVITPEEEDKVIHKKSQTLGGEPKVNILQNHHKENKMADPTHYVEIIDSPHGTLPRQMYHKVSEVVEAPVEEVQRNLSPYMERHQLRLQSQAINDKESDVGHRKQDIVATSRGGWKVGQNLASPAVSRRRDSTRDGHGLAEENSRKTP